MDPGQSGMGDFHTSREEEHQPGTNTTGCLALHPLLTFSSTSSHDPELPLDHVPELDIEPRPSDETEPEREEEELEREEEVEEELRPDGGPDPNAKSSRNPMLPSMFSSSWFRVLVSASSFSSLLTNVPESSLPCGLVFFAASLALLFLFFLFLFSDHVSF